MYQHFKRLLDLLAGLIGFIVIMPVFFIIALILKFTGEKEVFYYQERIGYKNKSFSIIKFASMLKNSSEIGNKGLTVRNDPRITPVGRILRITKLNEIPQVLNVIKGDMSLVGPRPLTQVGFSRYSEEVQSKIYDSRPGITGLGSLVFRDEEKLVTVYKEKGGDPSEYYKNYIYPYKGELELWYNKNQSLGVDFLILVLTFWSLVDANSNLVFKLLKGLPAKPYELTVSGVEQLVS